MITSKSGLRKLKAQLKKVGKEAERAQRSASYRASQSARTEMVKAARETYTVKAGDLNKTFKIKEHYGSFFLTSRGGMTALAKFKATNKTPGKRPKRGISVTVKKGQKKRLNQSGFLARVKKNGYVNIFFRRTEKRYPLDQRFGPGAPIMLGNEEVIKRGKKKYGTEYEKRLEYELNRELKKG